MSQVIDCPQCGRKLAVKPDFAGKRLRCPQCKEIFIAPSVDAGVVVEYPEIEPDPPPAAGGGLEHATSWTEPAAETPDDGASPLPWQSQGADTSAAYDSGEGEQASYQQSEVESANFQEPEASEDETPATDPANFLDGLHSSSPRAARTPRTPTRAPARPVARAPRGKSQGIPKEWIIGGAIGGGLVLFGLVLFIIAQSGVVGGGGGPSKNIKWGLTESQRSRVFFQCVEAVDNYGVNDNCKAVWKKIRDEYGITPDVMGKILDEGFDGKQNWDMPALKASQSQSDKVHRREWIVARKNGRDPLL